MKFVKGTFVVTILTIALVSSAVANVSITWQDDLSGSAYMYLADGVTLLPQDSIVQLIWSDVDSGLGAINPADPLTPTGANEQVLAVKGTDNLGYFTAALVSYDDGGSYVNGYVYQRIFATTMGNTPAIGSYYQESAASTALADQDVPPGEPKPSPSDSFFWDSGGNQANGFDVNMQIVPEPTTVALAAAGLGLLAVRFFRKKK